MVIKIDEEIGYWGISAYQVKRQLDEAEGDITIEINSPGGSVYEGIAIFNAIKAYDKGNVETVIIGIAASMASYIALAGDTVKAYDNAVYMIHNASVFVGGDFNYIRKKADVLEGLSNIIKNAYISKTSKSSEDLQKMMNDETYFFGNEILDNGFVDEIIETSNTEDENNLKALANESFKNCMNNVQMNTKEDVELIAAVTKDCEIKNKVVTIPTAKSDEIANSKKGNSMEYTKETFEALEKANAKALQDGKSDATALEKERVVGIMALGGNSDFTAKAIEDGSTVGDAAIAFVKSGATALATKKTDFEAAGEEVVNLEQDNSQEEMSADDKEWKDAENAKYGEKK